jgi:hypothetical protein
VRQILTAKRDIDDHSAELDRLLGLLGRACHDPALKISGRHYASASNSSG